MIMKTSFFLVRTVPQTLKISPVLDSYFKTKGVFLNKNLKITITTKLALTILRYIIYDIHSHETNELVSFENAAVEKMEMLHIME